MDSSLPYDCDACGTSFQRPSKFERHQQTEKHRRNVSVSRNQANPLEAEEDITDYHDYDVIEPGVEGSGHACFDETSVRNLEPDTPELIGNIQTLEQPTESDQTEWYPFENKVSFLLYTLIHSQTHHISNEVARFVWFVLKECGVKDIPAFSKIRDMKFGNIDVEKMIKKNTDPDGNPVYIISPTEILKLHLANPDMSSKIRRFPTVRRSIVQQTDGQRMHQIKSPWAKMGGNHFLVGDLVHNAAGDTGRIVRFLDDVENDTLLADLEIFVTSEHNLVRNLDVPVNSYTLTGETKRWPLRELTVCKNGNGERTWIELADGGWRETQREEFAQLENVSRYNPTVMVPLNLFLDDTAANTSRRWNALHCAQIQIAGVDKEYRQTEMYSDFVGATEKASAKTLCQSIIEDIQSCNRTTQTAYDASLCEEVIIKTDLALVVADYNMLAFMCNHMGATANKYCPKCNGDAATFNIKSRPRTPEETMHTINRLSIRCNEEDKKKIRTSSGIKEYENPFWDIINPHRDVPSGLLHLFHLGVSKHLIKFILDTLHSVQLADVQLHLESMDSSQKVESTVVKHIDSRQGKDIKNLIQVIPYSLAFAGVRHKYLYMICQLCELHQLVHLPAYKPEDIQKMEGIIEEYLHFVDMHAPALRTKVKTHLLTHMVDEIKQHGPPVSYSEDVFEKRHKAVRAKIFQQENQLARSRDTAQIFAKNIVFRHVISGGYFPVGKKWIQSSKQVQDLAKTNHLKMFLGDETGNEKDVNSLAKAERTLSRKSIYRNVSDFKPANVLLQGLIDAGITSPRIEGTSILYSAISTRHGKMLNVGDPVLYIDREEEEQIGILKGGILVLQEKRLQFAKIVPCKQVDNQKFGGKSFPCVKLQEIEELVLLQNVKSYVPLIHDCVAGKCTRREIKTAKRIEQQTVHVTGKMISHNDKHKVYFINQYSLLLPRELTKHQK